MAPAPLQDVLGQFPQLKTYNHGTLIFPLADDISHESVVSALESATAKIIAAIPWLAEQVIRVGVEPGDSGRFKLAPWPADAPKNTLVRVKDCADLMPTYEEIFKAQAPASMLDANLICPVPGFPMRGVLLTFSNQHNVMDGSGTFQIIAMLSTLMSGGELSDSARAEGNRDPKTVVPLYEPKSEIKDHSHMVIKSPISAPPASLKPASPSSWAYVRFSKAMVPKVKAQATATEGFDKSVPFISSNDAISAFYWKRLAIARVALGQDPSARSKFSRAIDARSAMGVSFEYMGQLVYFAATYFTYQEVIDLPLSTIASAMRKSLNDANNEYSVRSYATFIAGIKDKTTLAYGGPFNRATDIASSSMAQAAVVLKFGILGVPTLVRRPNLAPIPGTLYFYPPEASGDLNLLVCLNEQEREALRQDEQWNECTEYIG
ncbi:O-acetyltransferase [Hyphodiscus hymeniophilus]|uniref:O-acetyltransferase n=1 Tax=Hyphodiscus hymeniophilus TaxID=353542 RepID=A0A9P6VEH8_9HELO|nr:O-acetyltransferase [Hyphodiscus hymeniophilus]